MAKFGALDTTVTGSHTEREWLDLLEQWNWRCFYCAEPVQRNAPDPQHEATKDHMVPISRGGVDYIANIVPACLHCNQLKGNKTVEEFKADREWANAEKSTGITRCGARPSDPQLVSGVPMLPTLEIAAMWKRVLGSMSGKTFPDTRPEWCRVNTRDDIKAQAAAIIRRREENKRLRLESAGQLVLPIFGTGSARKLSQSEESTMPFKGMDVQERKA
jgi:hypothetical protein